MNTTQSVSKNTTQTIKDTLNYLFLLLFSFSVDYFLNASIGFYSVIFFFMFVIILSFSKRLFYFSVAVTAMLTVLYIPVSLQYGIPSFSMSVALFYTDKSEALGFISTIPIRNYFISLAFFVFSIFVVSRKYYPIKGRSRLLILSVTLLYAFVFPLYMSLFKNEEVKGYTTLIHYGPIKFITKNLQYLYQVKKEDDIIKYVLTQEATWQIDKVEKKKDMQIIVIGESVRRDFMHAYGFKIENTPFMTASQGVKFESFTSAGSSTVPSLLRMLCENNKSSYNIGNNLITLAKSSGIYTYWISNQDYIGLYDTPIASIGRLADNSHFLLSTYEQTVLRPKDEVLLPLVKDAIFEKLDSTQLIVVHLMGSHHPFCEITDGEFDEFLMTDEISCYVQSIKNTDKLLENIYTAALASQKSFNMIYFSDHGLNFTGNNELVHGGEYKQNYDVPLFIWSDDAVALDTISAARSGMDFMTFFSELAGLKVQSLEREYSFMSNDTCPKIRIFNHNYELRFYDELGDDRIKNDRI